MAENIQRIRTEQDSSSIITARRINERLQSGTLPPGGLILDRLCRGMVNAVASNGTSDTIFLPDATTVAAGWSVKIFSDLSSDVLLNVKNMPGSELLGLYAGECVEFVLTENSTAAGSWFAVAHDQGLEPELVAMQCDSSCFIGAAVAQRTDGLIYPAVCINEETSDVIGIVWRFAQPGYALVMQQGAIDVSALYGTLDVGKTYWLSKNDGLVTPEHADVYQPGYYSKRVGKAIDNKRLLVELGSHRILVGD